MTLFAAAIAASAFLLFLVQPIIAKQILPWFGGSAAVWTTCMVFFQCVLLAGYFYSDWSVRRLSPRRQRQVHLGVLLISVASLPILADETLKPVAQSEPISSILGLLAITIGLPYFTLSTTGPLLQAWFSQRFEQARVYRLYAISNVASMLALMAYPPAIEPFSTVHQQAWAWSAGYLAFVALAIACALVGWKAASATAPAGPTVAVDTPRIGDQLTWLGLAAIGSMMLLTITTHITQNVASVPFLWIVPLVIYLASFILCFDGRGWYLRQWYLPLSMLFCVLMLAGLHYRLGSGVVPEVGILHIEQAIPLYCLGLFIVCMFAHGELVERKPKAAHLTRFYLMISAGGALGGISVGIIAPVVFSWTWELALVLLAVLATALAIAGPPVRVMGLFALVIGAALSVQYARGILEDTIELQRNFYGTLRIKATADDANEGARWRLMHGVITHGEQFRAERFRRLATSYYGGPSGIGQALQALHELHANRGLRLGLVGLGVGTLAAYGEPKDLIRFYELNPAVLTLAEQRFSYLKDSKATIELAIGDARLELEREPAQRFDLLAIDAFSSDSIPVHLITREALVQYVRHLAPQGAIAFHVSNRYLDLTGVVKQLADDAGLKTLRVVHDPPESSFLYRSDWMILTRSQDLVDKLREQSSVVEVKPREQTAPGARLWTDSFNNLFEVLK
jgi:SAM-dependent methyltransferase